MSNVFAQLKDRLQKRIDDRNDPETVSVSYLDRLAIMQTSDRL